MQYSIYVSPLSCMYVHEHIHVCSYVISGGLAGGIEIDPALFFSEVSESKCSCGLFNFNFLNNSNL